MGRNGIGDGRTFHSSKVAAQRNRVEQITWRAGMTPVSNWQSNAREKELLDKSWALIASH
jgi:hypothetical protein